MAPQAERESSPGTGLYQTDSLSSACLQSGVRFQSRSQRSHFCGAAEVTPSTLLTETRAVRRDSSTRQLIELLQLRRRTQLPRSDPFLAAHDSSSPALTMPLLCCGRHQTASTMYHIALLWFCVCSALHVVGALVLRPHILPLLKHLQQPKRDLRELPNTLVCMPCPICVIRRGFPWLPCSDQ